ncbi:MAG: TonB-dependent receptor plug domain-containing protein [Prevotellaceae bacterium]|jgi:hypothetical protein|nr:TonB-dependent receptor plug domain-containing protein [Prevotellaceae bacterium]
MRKHYFILLFLATTPGGVFCQSLPAISVQSVRTNFIRQLHVFPQEKIYVHTDKPAYSAGETIWFKIYLTDAVVHYPSVHSRFVYLELIAPQQVIVRREKIRIAPSESCGQLELPASLPAGNYVLRAYSGTLFGMDEDSFFHRTIPLRSSAPEPAKAKTTGAPLHDDYDLSFFPEGGNLIAGAACKVAFKALNADGLAATVQGRIVDHEGRLVAPSFQSLHKGMGHFMLTPEPGKTYYALVENELRIGKKYPLPAVPESAVAVAAQWTGDTLRVSVNRTTDVADADTLWLLIHSRGIAQYVAPWDFSRPCLTLRKSDFPSGILQLLLLDKNGHPLSERLLFCHNDDQAQVSLKTNREQLSAREQLVVDVELTDTHNNPLTGHFSVAVTDNASVSIDTTSNILTYLLLTSDLRGHIENPAFYFARSNPVAAEALDNLMLTQGWRRYDMPEIAKGHWKESPGFVESGQEITGTVNGLTRKKGMANSKVRILSPENRFADETTTDENGRFAFTGLDFPNKTNFILQAFSKKGDDRVDLQVDEDEFPPIESVAFHAPPVRPPDSTGVAVANDPLQPLKMIRLQEVVITAKSPKPSGDFYSRMADNSFDSKKIEEIDATCVHELLRRIPGVTIQDDKAVIRGVKSIYGKPYAAIAIDGVIVESFADENDYDKYMDFDLDQINMMDIERVDVYKTGNTAIWGSRGGNGVVAFTTKKGRFNPSGMDRTRFNTKIITPLGYLVPAEFYSPKYETAAQKSTGVPDRRATLLWQPNVAVGEDGKASFDFYASDSISGYSIVIEGITNSGEIIYKMQNLPSH